MVGIIAPAAGRVGHSRRRGNPADLAAEPHGHARPPLMDVQRRGGLAPSPSEPKPPNNGRHLKESRRGRVRPMCARPPGGTQGPDHRPGRRTRRRRVGPGFGVERSKSRKLIFNWGRDSTTRTAGRGRVGPRLPGPAERLSPATEAASSQSRKRRAAQAFRAARRAFQPERGFSASRSVQCRSAGRTFNRQRKESRLDRRMLFVPGRAAALSFPRTTRGGVFHPSAPATIPNPNDETAPGFCFFFGGTSFFSLARDAFGFFRTVASIPSRTTARLRGFPITGSARFFPIRPGRSRGQSPAAAPVFPSRPDDAAGSSSAGSFLSVAAVHSLDDGTSPGVSFTWWDRLLSIRRRVPVFPGGRCPGLPGGGFCRLPAGRREPGCSHRRIIPRRGDGFPFTGRRYSAKPLPFDDASRVRLHSTDARSLRDYNSAVSLSVSVSLFCRVRLLYRSQLDDRCQGHRGHKFKISCPSPGLRPPSPKGRGKFRGGSIDMPNELGNYTPWRFTGSAGRT